MKHNLVFVSVMVSPKKRMFLPAIVLDQFGDKTLVATFKSLVKYSGYSNYLLNNSDYPNLKISLEFNGNIFLAKHTRIKESYIDFELSERDIVKFLKRLGIVELASMREKDYQAFVQFTSKYNKELVKKGAVAPIIKDKSGKLYTYYIEEIFDDGMICLPLTYDVQEGLKIKSYVREYVSYDVYVTGVYYTKLQEERIKNMLESNSLKLR